MKITRIDKSDGSTTEVSLDQAKERLEGASYYRIGTILELCKALEDFELASDWAIYRFEGCGQEGDR